MWEKGYRYRREKAARVRRLNKVAL